MKQLFIVIFLVLEAVPVLSGSLNFDSRFDFDTATFNDAAAKPNYSQFVMRTGRLNYQGKINDDLSFRLRLKFNTDATGTTKKDSLSSHVDYAYVKHIMEYGFSLCAGKMGTEMAGWEGTTPTPDMYFKSQGLLDVNSSSQVATPYASGLKVSYVSDRGLT